MKIGFMMHMGGAPAEKLEAKPEAKPEPKAQAEGKEGGAK